MKGIYREISNPEHVVKVLERSEEGITYEDGGNIICTRRIANFDKKFEKDTSATIAEFISDFKPSPAIL